MAVDTVNATDFTAFHISPLDPASSMEMDPIPIQLQKSPVRRARGRPRRQVPLEIPALEPIRKLRSQKNATKAISQDPWTNLSNTPPLTPSSPKKQRQTRTLQGPRQPPVNSILLLLTYHLMTISPRGQPQERQ